jgi:Na+-transporting methylmalonyl-CoA/oxaloacetate decarboxylase gamma subunit
MNNLILSAIGIENAYIALAGISLVFVSLAVLYLFFRAVPKIVDRVSSIRMKKHIKGSEQKQGSTQITAEVDAAISAAIYMFFNEIHDNEDTIMTIKKISKAYSPWSSKLYSMRWPLR